MLYVVDGSNVLGRLGGGLHDEAAKRDLVTRVASFARSRNARAVCFFDGPAPPGFARSLGHVAVRFTPGSSADDAIAQLIREQVNPVTLISADLALFSRVRGRRVERLSPAVLRAEIPNEERLSGDDWESYFSDPKNRNI